MSPPPPPWDPPRSNQCAAPGLLLALPAEPTAASPSLWTRPLARSNLRPRGQMSVRDQGPAGAPRRRCPGHAPASFSFPRSLSVSQTLSFSLCPVRCHGYSSWPPFAASSSSSSGRRRWPLCLEPLHPLHRAGALARAQAPGRHPRVSLPDPAAVGTPGTTRAMDRSQSLPWSSATGRIQFPEGRIRPYPTALARIPSSQPVSVVPGRPLRLHAMEAGLAVSPIVPKAFGV